MKSCRWKRISKVRYETILDLVNFYVKGPTYLISLTKVIKMK